MAHVGQRLGDCIIQQKYIEKNRNSMKFSFYTDD